MLSQIMDVDERNWVRDRTQDGRWEDQQTNDYHNEYEIKNSY